LVSNAIVRNLKISNVLANTGSGIAIRASHNVWVDHRDVDLSSNMNHDYAFYGGLLDIVDSSVNVTVTYSKIHDDFKATIVEGDGESREYTSSSL
jgi:pectate lyase